MRQIGLLDCNNFFVSCERLFRPDLRKKPVVVLSSNDGCVIARSQEIKDSGIPMGVPYFQIKDKLRDLGATRFSSNFTLYRDISRRVFEVVRRHATVVEEYSIDECFFILEADDLAKEARFIKDAVEQEVGIPVSIGVAKSKTLAKYANGQAKKTTGVSVLSDLDWQHQMHTVPLHSLWGVGAARTKAFKEKGINTVSELLALSTRQVGAWFGIEGVRLQSELLGIPTSLVSQDKDLPQSVTSSRSFAVATTEKAVVSDAIAFHTHQVVADLVKAGVVTRSVRIFFYPSRHSDYFMQGYSEEVTFVEATNDLRLLLKTVQKLVDSGFQPSVPYKKAGVMCTDLSPQSGQTQTLFTVSPSANVTVLVTSLQQRFGAHALQMGRTTATKPVWSARQEKLSPCYTTDWSSLKTVKA